MLFEVHMSHHFIDPNVGNRQPAEGQFNSAAHLKEMGIDPEMFDTLSLKAAEKQDLEDLCPDPSLICSWGEVFSYGDTLGRKVLRVQFEPHHGQYLDVDGVCRQLSNLTGNQVDAAQFLDWFVGIRIENNTNVLSSGFIELPVSVNIHSDIPANSPAAIPNLEQISCEDEGVECVIAIPTNTQGNVVNITIDEMEQVLLENMRTADAVGIPSTATPSLLEPQLFEGSGNGGQEYPFPDFNGWGVRVDNPNIQPTWTGDEKLPISEKLKKELSGLVFMAFALAIGAISVLSKKMPRK